MGSHGHKHPRTNSRAGWWITAVIAVSVYAAGVYGFRLQHKLEPDAHQDGSPADPFYHGFQLFLIEPPHDGEMNKWIEIGRWGALALDMFAVVMLGRRMFAQEIARARLSRVRDHFVVSAGNDDARAIAAAICARHPRATIAIIDAAHRAGDVVERIGRRTYVVPGDLRSKSSTVNLHEAAEVIIAGSDDAANFASAMEICAIANLKRGAQQPLVCHVQIQGVNVRETLRAGKASGDHAYVRPFDRFEQAVTRLLTRDLPLDGNGIAATDSTEVHVVIVGGGDWALAVAVACLRLGHFANGRPLRLTVVTEDASAWSKRLGTRTRAVAEVARYEVRTAGPLTSEGAQWLRNAALAPDTRLLVVIAQPSDADAVEVEAAVRDAVRDTAAGVAVRLQHGAGMSTFLRDGGRQDRVEVVPFGWLDDEAWAGLLEDGDREEMARLAHTQFEDMAHAHGRSETTDEVVTPWRKLKSGGYRESNRQQVDHIRLKLRAVRCEAAPASDARQPAEWSKDEIDVLAKMEHSRWEAERRLSGWRLGPKDSDRRISPYLVPWAELEEEIRDYDRNAVRNIPDLVRSVNDQKICRR